MTWYDDAASLIQAVETHGSPTQAANNLGGISPRAARDRWKKLGLATPARSSEKIHGAGASSQVTENKATLISAANPQGTQGKTPEEMLVEHGLDPAEWDYRVSATSWDAPVGDGAVTTLHRIKVDAVRRAEAIEPLLFESSWEPPKARRARKPAEKPRMIVGFADPHFPLDEPSLTEGAVAFLEDHEHEIDSLICVGDASDASPFKRHKANKRTDVTVQEHLAGTYEGLARWRNAIPNAPITLIRGNHDTWFQSRLLEMFPSYMELKRPGEDFGLLTLRSVLGLDTLRIETVETNGEYHDDVVQVLEDLVAIHGVAAGRDGAIKEQAGWEGASLLQGHAHKCQINMITKRLPGGGESQRFSINMPSMARRDLGYSHKHDVSQGFVYFYVWPDGRWVPNLAVFDPETECVTAGSWRWNP